MADEVADACGLSKDAAQKLLDAADGDVTSALQMHFDAMDEGEPLQPQPQQETARAASSRSDLGSSGPAAPKTKHSQLKKTGITSLRDFANSDEDDEENYYAGGKSSGQVVQGNPNANSEKQISNIFKKAREHGAMTDEQYSESQNEKPKTRWGRGHRLGDTSEPSREDEPAPEDPLEHPEEVTRERVVRFWRNGFSIDDGPLRRTDDPQHQEFINSINRGEVPMELRMPKPDEDPRNMVGPGRRVTVHAKLEDNRDRDYEPPKKVFKPFSGGGNTLGSPVPEVKTSSSPSASMPREPANSRAKALAVDETKPMTKLQIRLHNGTRMVMNFNNTHTVGDLRDVMRSAQTDGPASFEIRQMMPPRVYNDDKLTIEAAGLLRASVVQKPIKD